jgi:hypothetical protein
MFFPVAILANCPCGCRQWGRNLGGKRPRSSGKSTVSHPKTARKRPFSRIKINRSGTLRYRSVDPDRSRTKLPEDSTTATGHWQSASEPARLLQFSPILHRLWRICILLYSSCSHSGDPILENFIFLSPADGDVSDNTFFPYSHSGEQGTPQILFFSPAWGSIYSFIANLATYRH